MTAAAAVLCVDEDAQNAINKCNSNSYVYKRIFPEQDHQHGESHQNEHYLGYESGAGFHAVLHIYPQQKQEDVINHERPGQEKSFRHQCHLFFPHELKSHSNIAEGEDQKQMYHHVSDAVCNDTPVYQMIVTELVTLKESYDYEETHQSKIHALDRDPSFKIS